MNRLLFIGFYLVMCLLFHSPLWGQSHTYVGVELAVHEDQNSISEDSGGRLNTIPSRGGILGLNIRRGFNTKWFFETGIFYKVYYQSIIFNQPRNYPYLLNAFYCLHVPFRVGYVIRLTDKVSLIPEPGISVGFNILPYNGSFGGAATTINGSRVDYSAKANYEQRFFVLINPSIALERVFFDSLILSLYAGRSWGLTEISELVVDYTIDNSSSYTGSIVNSGNFFYGGVSLKYPIGKK